MSDFNVGDRVRVQFDGMLFEDAVYIGASDTLTAQVEWEGDRFEPPFSALTVTALAHYAPPGVAMVAMTPDTRLILEDGLEALRDVATLIRGLGDGPLRQRIEILADEIEHVFLAAEAKP